MSEKSLLPVFFLVETSSNMAGEPILQVNSFMENAIKKLKELQNDRIDAGSNAVDIKIAVLTFSSVVKWVTKGLVDLNTINRKDFTAGVGNADINKAYIALNEGLSRKAGLLKEADWDSHSPIIFFLANGNYTGDWVNSKKELDQNFWYKKSLKYAFTFGKDTNNTALKDFTKSEEAVFPNNFSNLFLQLIRFDRLYNIYNIHADEKRNLEDLP